MARHKNEDSWDVRSGLKALTIVKTALQKERIRINTEIGNYPPPIPACDVQFNYLLKQRSDIARALKLVDGLMTRCQTQSVDVEIVEKLIKPLSKIDATAADELRAAFTGVDS